MHRALRFASVCSGIEAASVAWHPLGWRTAFVSEIDKAASAVLAHHYPETPNMGDMTKWENWPDAAFDVLVGGTPCQSFSVAGLRKGLDDPRGSLMLVYGAIAKRYRPRWLVWENVPGVLSSNGGRDFGSFLGMLAVLGYGFAYRVLDAQFFGLAQRRARAFVVGYLGDWRPPAAVLFERESLRGDPAPSREAGEGTAPTIAGGARTSGGYSHDDIPLARCVTAGEGGRLDYETTTMVTHALTGEGFDASEDGTGRGTPLVAHSLSRQHGVTEDGTGRGVPVVAFSCKDHGADAGSIAPTLRAMGHDGSHANAGGQLAVAFDTTQMTSKANRSNPQPGDPCHPLAAGAHAPAVAFSITPSNSNKDYNARAVDKSQALTAGGNRPSARGGDIVIGSSHANAPQTGPVEALRALRDAVGEEAFAQWGSGVLASLLPAEVLRSALHGGGVRRPTEPKHGLVHFTLSRAQDGSTWTVRDLWDAGCDGCPPQGWRPHEQLARELGAHLSKLPYAASSAQVFMHDLRRAGEGSRLLREALSAVEEAWRPAGGEAQSASSGHAVRRLTADECETLQGFPRGYTLIPYRGKTMADGPRYKMLGNSFAVPVVRWIGERIQLVDDMMHRAPLRATGTGHG